MGDAFHVLDVVVALTVGAALATDLSRQRVPNTLTIPVAALGVAYWTAQGDGLFALAGLGVAFGMLFPGFLFGGAIRAGDAKLMMAVGAFWGPAMMFRACVFTYALAIPFGLVVLTLKGKLGNVVAVARSAVTPLPGPENPVVVPFVPILALALLIARTTGVLA